MPRRSPLLVELSAEQRRELEVRDRRYALPYGDAWCFLPPKISTTPRSPRASTPEEKSSRSGGNASSRRTRGAWRNVSSAERPTPGLFPLQGSSRSKRGHTAIPFSLGHSLGEGVRPLWGPTGIDPFGRLAKLVIRLEPYVSTGRVCWRVDNGSSHHSKSSVGRLPACWPHRFLVHVPNHAAWLNQVEIYRLAADDSHQVTASAPEMRDRNYGPEHSGLTLANAVTASRSVRFISQIGSSGTQARPHTPGGRTRTAPVICGRRWHGPPSCGASSTERCT